MPKFLDDRSYATDPAVVRLSHAKLGVLEPELFTERTFKCGPTCPVDHLAAEMRERIEEHLLYGDSRAAIVVSVRPLVVAAYSDDLDAVVLLRYPLGFAAQYGLVVGSRLLTVNTYTVVHDEKTGVPLYAVDLVPGPSCGPWSNFGPMIAEFLSDDLGRIEARKREIREEEWRTALARAETRIQRMGLDTARLGKPTLAFMPVRPAGQAESFQPVEVPTGHTISPVPAPPRWAVLAVLLAIAALFILLRLVAR